MRQGRKGSAHPLWKGGRKTDVAGYVWLHRPDHPRQVKGYVREHVLIVEAVIGRLLPLLAVVHHVNDLKSENRNDNLVVLPDQAYHVQLHERRRVLRVGGDPWTQKICGGACGQPKPFDHFYLDRRGRLSHRCRECAKAHERRKSQRPRSECHPGSKLTPDDVRAIRTAVSAGERQADIARSYGVSRPVINDIVKYRKWKAVA